MSEESAEHLVRLYLESEEIHKDSPYLVVTGRKFNIGSSRVPDVDIIAVNPKTGHRILGEVKAWVIGCSHFKELCQGEFKPKEDRFKIVNDEEFRKTLIEKVQKDYGDGFKIYLYVGGIQKNSRDRVRQFLEDKGIRLFEMENVVSELLKSKRKDDYSKDPAMQLLIYLKRWHLVNGEGNRSKRDGAKRDKNLKKERKEGRT